MIQFATLDSSLGKFGIHTSKKEICQIFLPNSSSYQTMPRTPVEKQSSILKLALDELNQYFLGERRKFTVPFDLMLPPYFNKVLKAVSKIPFGHTASYQDIAVQTGNPKAVRAVGNANAKNPIPIIIPCHRVITSSGKLGGYGGGTDLKEMLLHHEGVNLLNSFT
ncbi:MAG: methylated-DNA--[protein]-cysteine S-methyltransferase [Candidatus Neomarinimicrobiota bacterium]|jgi:methylated-DNA-[protein]-cysteine S-methyltransferase|nr:methylated-DNA--[protein]-cysteine S-methyltransferase [Candidatus Neomarinimicrobiota bacterium]|tara:strand:- start:605 stop:1099 length:495 start_codon:yes stop_codon:yes gene_type:complete